MALDASSTDLNSANAKLRSYTHTHTHTQTHRLLLIPPHKRCVLGAGKQRCKATAVMLRAGSLPRARPKGMGGVTIRPDGDSESGVNAGDAGGARVGATGAANVLLTAVM